MMMKSIYKSAVVILLTVIFTSVFAQTASASAKDGEGIVYEGSTATIALSDTYKRTLRKATSVTYSWSSENTSYMTVASSTQYYATIKGIRPTASCKLYFRCSYYIDGYYRTMDIYYDIMVKRSSVSVTNVLISQSAASMKVGETLQLTASVYPTNATNRNVNWMSNNNTVASVSSTGLVQAKSTGTATITCIAADGSGCRDLCTVTVVSDETSGILSVEKDMPVMNVSDGCIVFSDDVDVIVYCMDGTIVFGGRTRCLAGLRHGVYIVKIGKIKTRIVVS